MTGRIVLALPSEECLVGGVWASDFMYLPLLASCWWFGLVG